MQNLIEDADAGMMKNFVKRDATTVFPSTLTTYKS